MKNRKLVYLLLRLLSVFFLQQFVEVVLLWIWVKIQRERNESVSTNRNQTVDIKSWYDRHIHKNRSIFVRVNCFMQTKTQAL